MLVVLGRDMTDLENRRLDTSGERLIAKGTNAPKSKCNNLLKNGFKLNLRKKNGYKTVLSKSNEDLSTHKDSEDREHDQILKECGSKKGSPLGSPTTETWFNTWPERCDKVKGIESSPEHLELNNVNTQNAFSNKLTLSEALKNISLAYSPVTRKLHLVEDVNTTKNDITESQHDNKEIDDCDNKLGSGDIVKENSSPFPSPAKKFGHRRIQEGSFSSTISTLSEPSTSGSLIGSEDRSLSNFGGDETGCTEEKTRRKSLTQFFTK